MELTGYEKTRQGKGKTHIQNRNAHTDKKSKSKISVSGRFLFPSLSRQARKGLLLCTGNMLNVLPNLGVNHFILSCCSSQLVLYRLKPFCTPTAQSTWVPQLYLSHLAHPALEQSKRSSTGGLCAASASAVLP